MPRSTDERHLTGNYAPVTEETTIADLAVDGAIPHALSGQYLRIGPNPIGTPPQPYDWPDSDPMVHSITLRAGRAVAYRNRWVNTDAAASRRGNEPAPGPRRSGTDATGTTVLAFAGSILSFGDGALAYQLSAELDTVRRVDLAGGARGVGGHPAIDPHTADLHLLSFADDGTPSHVVVSSNGMTRRSRTIADPPGRIEALAVARDHVVLFGDGFAGVMARSGDTRVEWATAGAGAVHPVSAHDDGDTVVVHTTGAALERWTFDASSESVRRTVLDPAPQAFGRVDERLLGTNHRFLWTIGAAPELPFDGTDLHEHDLVSGTRQSHEFGPGRHPGELVFVADPARAGTANGGWLVGFVHDDARHEADLVVLDAAVITRPPLAIVHIPRRIPYGLHGAWIPTNH